MLGYIYVHVNRINGKCYVGQTVNIESRWYPRSYNHCPRFQSAIKHYGWGGFDRLVLLQKEMTNEEMDYYEQVWISVLRAAEQQFGYNIAVGGSGSAGYPRPSFSDETKRKISEARKGAKFSAEHRANLSVARRRRVISEEEKIKISKSLVGKTKKPFSDEHKRNLSIAHLGYKHPPEVIEKIRQSGIAIRRKKKVTLGATTTGRESECGSSSNSVH
jgi:group I intron endonuclease